jgi:hypothetical protein
MNLDLANELVAGPEFAPLFLQDGYAVLLRARLLCTPEKQARIEFEIEFLEPDETQHVDQDPGEVRDYHFTTGVSRHSQTPEGLIVAAATASGPFRGGLLHFAHLDQLREALSDLRGRIWEELDSAHDQPGAVFQRDRLASAECLLEELCDHWKDGHNDTEAARFLNLPAPSDCPKLH